MLTREERYRLRVPLHPDGVEGLLILYAMAYADLLNARAHARLDEAAGWQAQCDKWLARLSARLSPARFAFEMDEARRYGEEEARDAERFWERWPNGARKLG